MQVRPGLELAALTDVGCQRENNEDSYSYWESASDSDFNRKGRLIAIADGMGGHEGGQEASQLAIATLEQFYAKAEACDPPACLVAAMHEAHAQIKEAALENLEFRGMGTTCTAVVLLRGKLYFAHIGDSRLYLIREGSMTRLTHDHSYVGKMVEEGVLSSEQAETHPQRHILTAALGAGEDISPETAPAPVAMRDGDVIVLCTDGLWGLLTDSEILNSASRLTPEAACRELVGLARERGGPDNITVQIAKISLEPVS